VHFNELLGINQQHDIVLLKEVGWVSPKGGMGSHAASPVVFGRSTLLPPLRGYWPLQEGEALSGSLRCRAFVGERLMHFHRVAVEVFLGDCMKGDCGGRD
jgi:hypothetical protein